MGAEWSRRAGHLELATALRSTRHENASVRRSGAFPVNKAGEEIVDDEIWQ
jgi:hypothetical protein